jgi:hypothetical protein
MKPINFKSMAMVALASGLLAVSGLANANSNDTNFSNTVNRAEIQNRLDSINELSTSSAVNSVKTLVSKTCNVELGKPGAELLSSFHGIFQLANKHGFGSEDMKQFCNAVDGMNANLNNVAAIGGQVDISDKDRSNALSSFEVGNAYGDVAITIANQKAVNGAIAENTSDALKMAADAFGVKPSELKGIADRAEAAKRGAQQHLEETVVANISFGPSP